MKPKVKKARKPRDLKLGHLTRASIDQDDWLWVDQCAITKPKEARKLADWLTRAALYLEGKK